MHCQPTCIQRPFTVLALPPLFVLALWAEREGRMGVREEEGGEREAERGRMGMRKNKEREDGD